MNAFNLSNQGLSFLWQEMRDAAKWEFEASENDDDRDAKITIAALGNEAADTAAKRQSLVDLANWAADLWTQGQ